MAENTREIILDMLLEMEKGGGYANSLIRDVLDKYDYLGQREKSFIKRVTEGTVERRLELDYYLDALSSVPVRKMKPLIRCLLRMSAYQMIYMDAVPDSAVCNEACKLAVKRKFGSLKGFVNGVLRSVSRNRERLPLPDRDREPVRYLSVRYSMPEWLVEMWLAEYGETITDVMLEKLLEIHPVSLRFSTKLSAGERDEIKRQLEREGVALRGPVYLPYMGYLERCDSVRALPGFAAGKWTVQDVSSALAVELAGIKGTDLVMDVCAAPGGKSILAAEKAQRVLSRDISEEKCGLIRENLSRMGVGNVDVQVWDAGRFDASWAEKADVLLLDVPCSGLGVIGKKRDIKYHVSPEGIESLKKLQREIAGACTGYLKKGGILLYSTCTVNPGENEEMVRFLAGMPGLEPVSLEEELPEELLEQKRVTEALRGEEGRLPALNPAERRACIQFLPGYMETDGFFIAKFRKG